VGVDCGGPRSDGQGVADHAAATTEIAGGAVSEETAAASTGVYFLAFSLAGPVSNPYREVGRTPSMTAGNYFRLGRGALARGLAFTTDLERVYARSGPTRAADNQVDESRLGARRR
jgi:hypothetical protein